jgi:hypothetical protein
LGRTPLLSGALSGLVVPISVECTVRLRPAGSFIGRRAGKMKGLRRATEHGPGSAASGNLFRNPKKQIGWKGVVNRHMLSSTASL